MIIKWARGSDPAFALDGLLRKRKTYEVIARVVKRALMLSSATPLSDGGIISISQDDSAPEVGDFLLGFELPGEDPK